MKIGTISNKDFLAGRNFFSQTHCDRCKQEFTVARTTSWFTEETICVERCGKAETKLRARLREKGLDTPDLEGCGYVPDERR